MFKLSVRADRDKQEIAELKEKLRQSEKLESLLAETRRNNDWLLQQLEAAKQQDTRGPGALYTRPRGGSR